MRVSHDRDRITIRDRPGSHWLLGILLLSGGLFGIAATLGLAENAADLGWAGRLMSIGIGGGVAAGALWWLWRSPGSRIELDRTRASIRMTRTGLTGRRELELLFGDVAAVVVEQREDSDGGIVGRPALRLTNGRTVLLSELWLHNLPNVRAVAQIVAETCGLPAP
jgi:hypothetical protein